MPKGSGAAQAFAADEEALKNAESNPQQDTRTQQPRSSASKKVTVTLPEDVLYAADYKVLQLKRAGIRIDRSLYLADLVRKDTET